MDTKLSEADIFQVQKSREQTFYPHQSVQVVLEKYGFHLPTISNYQRFDVYAAKLRRTSTIDRISVSIFCLEAYHFYPRPLATITCVTVKYTGTACCPQLPMKSFGHLHVLGRRRSRAP